ncbi:MAG: diguanylate cyclase [Gemmatimonadota bacterium]|nr:diguanylate cyclase [Gemmatimonadota bacterium]
MPVGKAWNKKTILVALHVCVAAITTVLLWQYPPAEGRSLWVMVPWGLYLAATLGLVLLPLYWFVHRRFDLVFIGAEAMLLGPLLAGYFGGEAWAFYPLLLLGVLLAALARRLLWAVGMGAAVAAAHVVVNWEQFGLDPGVVILQTVLIVTVAGFVGYLTEELSREEATTALLDNALEISTLLTGVLEAKIVYERLTELISRLFRAGRVAVILAEPESETARVAAAVDQGEKVTEVMVDLDRYPEIRIALERRAPVVITRPDEDPQLAGVRSKLPDRARRSSILVTPILQDDEPRGVVFVRLEASRHEFSDHEIKFCRLMADAAGQALERAEHYAEVAEAARRDGLTGLFNVRVFHRRLAEEVDRAGRTGAELSLVMVDVDYLKNVNDTYGHLAGDRVIRQMAEILQEEVRSIDTVARYGGEEFALLLPETGGDRALVVAERIRVLIEDTSYEPVREPVTVSIGIATLPDDATTPTELIHKADQALYASKNRGRNRTTRYARDGFEEAPEERAGIPEPAEDAGPDQPSSWETIRDEPIIHSLRDTLESLELGHERVRRLDVVTSLASVMRARDPTAFEQLRSVSTVAEIFLAHLPVPERQRWAIHVACLLRDIGKLVISEELLKKQGFLTRDEYRLVRRHPEVGAEILAPLQGFEAVVPFILHHHERWDGKGYPEGLVGEEIPYGARVVGLLDAFQAMVRRRPYADRARGLRYACEEIRRNGGTQFDPDLAERFLLVVDENKDIISTLVAEKVAGAEGEAARPVEPEARKAGAATPTTAVAPERAEERGAEEETVISRAGPPESLAEPPEGRAAVSD